MGTDPVFTVVQATGHGAVTTSTGGSKFGVRGAAEVPRPGAALPPRRSGVHYPSRGYKPPLGTALIVKKPVQNARPQICSFA